MKNLVKRFSALTLAVLCIVSISFPMADAVVTPQTAISVAPEIFASPATAVVGPQDVLIDSPTVKSSLANPDTAVQIENGAVLISKQEPPKPYEKVIASNGPWYSERLSIDGDSELILGYEGTFAIDGGVLSQFRDIKFKVTENVVLTGIYIPYTNTVAGALTATLKNNFGESYGPFALSGEPAIAISVDSPSQGEAGKVATVGETNYSYLTNSPVALKKGDYTLVLSDPAWQVRTRQTGPNGAFLLKGMHADAYGKYIEEMKALYPGGEGPDKKLGDDFLQNPDGAMAPAIMKQATFVLEKNSVIEEIIINTKNKGQGRAPGLVAILDEKGEPLYVEQAQGLPLGDLANGMWAIVPEIVLPPGNYQVALQDPLFFEYQENGNPMFYVNVTDAKPARFNFTGTYKINMDAYKRSTLMGPVTDNDSDFSLKDFELTVLDKGGSIELVGRYEGMPFSQLITLTEGSETTLKGTFDFAVDLSGLPTKQKITASGEMVLVALNEETIMIGIKGPGTYSRDASKDKGADYNTYEYFVKGKRVKESLPPFVVKALGAAALVGAGNVPGPEDPVQAATGLLFPPLVGVVAHVVTEMIKKAAEKEAAEKAAKAAKAAAEKAAKKSKYTREGMKAANPGMTDEAAAWAILAEAMGNTDEPDEGDVEAGSDGDGSDGSDGSGEDGSEGSEGSEVSDDESGGDEDGDEDSGDSDSDSEGDDEGGYDESESAPDPDAEAEAEADLPNQLTEEDFMSLEEKAERAAAAAQAKQNGQGAEGTEGSEGSEGGDGKATDATGSTEPKEPKTMTLVTGIDGKTSTYEFNEETGKWTNPLTGGEFNETQYNDLKSNLDKNQAWQDTERDNIASGNTAQDKALAQMVADQKQKAYEQKIMDKYGVKTKDEAKAIINKMQETETKRSEKWQTIGNIAAVGEQAATVVVAGADTAVDFLASQTGPAGKIINAGYKITKSVASEIAEKGVSKNGVAGALVKGVTDAATDFTDSKVIKGALTIGGETVGNYLGSEKGKEWESISNGLVSGTMKVGTGLITDKLAGPGFGDEMSITKLGGDKVRVALNSDGKWMGAVVKASTGQRIYDNKVTSQIVQSGTKMGSSLLDNYVVKPYVTDNIGAYAADLPNN